MRANGKKLCLFFAVILSLAVLPGCMPKEEESVVDTKTAILGTVADVKSVESAITLEMKAHIGSTGSEGAHNANIGSDITLQMTAEPLSIYAQYYSRIQVDGVVSRDDREYYIVPEEKNLVKYLYVEAEEEWQRSTLTKAEAMAVPAQTGLIFDWNSFLSYLTEESSSESIEGRNCKRLSGQVPTDLFQELFGNNVFGTFMYSTEMLLTPLIPCVLYVDEATYQPIQILFTFNSNFIVSDMVIDTALVTVNYRKWNEIPSIELPRKIEIVATNPNLEFYNTFYAWNLFLPYINNKVEGSNGSSNSGLSFASDWSTFQLRIDGSMTKLPILYSDMENVGYDLDSAYRSTIIEANKYIENVPLKRGNDTLYCTVYNPDAAPQPISACSIGAIDLSAANNPNAGILIYLPGEVSLGITKDSLISAYGKADLVETAFAADTYTWNGENDNQSFVAEVSPSSGQVIRIVLRNIPVTGGKQ